MRVDLVDAPAYSLPYDDAVARSLARHGAQVRLLTSEFAYGDPPAPGHGVSAYTRDEFFYRHAVGAAGSRLRALNKRAEHIPDMLRYRRDAARNADISHFEWLTIPRLDLRLLPDGPTVLTIHDPLERGGRRPPLQADAFTAVDAIVVHSEYAREQVLVQHGLHPGLVHVIRMGAFGPADSDRPADSAGAVADTRGEKCRATRHFSPLEDVEPAVPGEKPVPTPGFLPRDEPERPQLRPESPELPPELTDDGSPVVLCFGLIRPYKGVDTVLQAWRGIDDAQLWVVGRPMIDLAPLRAAAPKGAEIVPRFVDPREEQALFERADIVVLPYERSDRFGFSAVLATALGYGKTIVLSDVGGLSEVGSDPSNPAARLVPPGDPDALHAALADLLTDGPARARLAAAAAHAAATTYSWDTAAEATLALYEKILRG
jgi:glycosyltransferase involved in cell wall biosynthesis